MTQTLIEKLEALPRWWGLTDGKSKLVLDAYAVVTIIEQEKAEKQEPVAEIVLEKYVDWMDPHAAIKWHTKDFEIGTKFYITPPDQSARIAELESHRDRLLAEFKKVRQTLEDENNDSLSAITDTIWMQEGNETLFDYMDALIAEIEAEK